MQCKHLFFAFLLGLSLNATALFAQDISVVSTTPPTPGTPSVLSSAVANFTLDAADCTSWSPCIPLTTCSGVSSCSTKFFIIYGDGHFDAGTGYTLPLTHKYATPGATYTAKAYFAKKKDVDPPDLRSIDVIPGSGGSYTNSPSQMYGKNIKVGTSWLPVAGQQQFVILTIANTCGYCPSGTVDFYFNSNQVDVNHGDFSTFNAGTLSNPTVMSPATTLYNARCTLSYSGLLVGTQQSFFIPVTVKSLDPGSAIHYGGIIKPKTITCNNATLNVSDLSLNTGLAAHDPNSKTVNIESICANSPSIMLEYRIIFQNDGAAFAGPIVVTDVLDDTQVDPTTVVLTSFSEPCIYSTDPSNSSIALFTFPNIQLPGANQTIPEKYDPSESYCEFTFTVNTLPNLPVGVIPNSAKVTFYPDGSSLETNIANVVIQEYSDDNPNCEIRERYSPNQKSTTSSSQLIVAPNPFSNALKIISLSNPLDETTQIEILDLSGRIITLQTIFDEPEWNLLTSDWPVGLYFIRIQTASKVAIHRVVKQ